MSLLRSGYYCCSWLGAPFVLGYLRWRAYKGYEDKSRLKERIGIASLPRPEKPLLWVNAVSVGEAVAALTIIKTILKKYPDVHVLLTTTTVSSAKVIEKRLSKNIIHQFCPVDTPQAVQRFLDHWQPDLAIWIESELWPNLIYETQEKGIPTILLNGRMSFKSFANWQNLKSVISPLLSRLDLCGVQSEKQASFFKALGATTVSVMGNVKLMMDPLEIDLKKYHALQKEVGSRPLWLAASTHPGEDEIVLRAHKMLKKDYPDLLTILVPRHIERASSLQHLILKEELSSALRTEEKPLKEVEIYIGNTLGEMGLFYALSPVVLMGATFVPKGGHNPIEAAQLGTYVLHGPHTFKNPQLYESLAALGLSTCLQEEGKLSSLVHPWLQKQKESYEEPLILKSYREEGLQRLIRLLAPYLKSLRKNEE
ncbi:MAG: 3-deoxy-D-manno-octulosonic acid transferase [Alphaproteobacteria bacterium]|jgi:3-deoxy-D-manno-octulosonic-acid transferase|nr:3-deoxy-D-manno-octulosonic acid transferase [Alphaproteobacteria bacterium]MBP7729567.1 3-deoxy-D-manno-octulosonic acid transferase [Alphaproteobacteria bacterium]